MTDREGQTNGRREETVTETGCVVSHAVIHFAGASRADVCCTAPPQRTHAHHVSQEETGPVGQSQLRVFLFTSNYRNRAISAAPLVFFSHICE